MGVTVVGLRVFTHSCCRFRYRPSLLPGAVKFRRSDLLDGIINESVFSIEPCTYQTKEDVIQSQSTNEPKIKLYCENGKKLSDTQIERNRKNAIAARINRQKKKEYLTSLESQVSSLSSANETLKQKCDTLQLTVNSLQHEVHYLKSVLANETTLSTILSGLPNIKGVQLTTGKHMRDATTTIVNKKVKRDNPLQFSGGICLHIADDVASLELCSHCSLKAKAN